MTAGTQSSKPWYKTWKLIPAIIFLPFTLMYLTWKTKWPTLAKVIVIGLIFVTMVGASTNDSSDQPPTDSVTEVTEVKVEKPQEETETSQNDLSLEERLDILAKDKIDQDVTLSYEEETGFVVAEISTADYTFINNTDMANSIWKFYIKFAEEAFNYENVNEIKVAITTEFIDSYGKSVFDDAVYVDMLKEDFELFNWDALKFSNPRENQELLTKSNYYVHPIIFKDVKLDKLKMSYL